MITSSKTAEKITLTVLVDNKADLIVKSEGVVTYFTDKPLLAEHGYSVFIQTDGYDKHILWDAGVSEVALIENMHRMELDFQSISKIAISHGHHDHVAAVTAVLKEMHIRPTYKKWSEQPDSDAVENWITKNQIPLICHPAAFRERWKLNKDGTMVGPVVPPSIQEWQAAGARILTSQEPTELAPGCWTTGFVPRTSFEKAGRSSSRFYREGAEFKPDDIEDDQAIVFHLKGKGLVVLSGCAHAGIVNTIKRAQSLTGVNRVHAIIGGLHLAQANDTEIDKTIAFIKSLEPAYVIPSHCTGFKAICRFSQEMPDQFIEGVVGATYTFQAD